ncbi:MAG: hypothetical protein R3200_15995 [Xanthomonadales bacterium]|nr:hypothetical protein [Xanthomonadales bacterium]
MSSSKNQRHQLLVKQQFQFNYIVVALVTVLVTVNLVIIGTLLALGGTAKIGFTPMHGAAIGVVELVLVGVMSWLGLKKSHTIAGPVMVLERNMGWVQNGDLAFTMTLRKTDHFQESATAFNAMLGELRDRIGKAQEEVGRLKEAAQGSAELQPIIQRLDENLSYFKIDSEQEATKDAGTNADA